MGEEPNNNLKTVGSTANLMMEAVDKVSRDLEATIQLSTDRLKTFNESLSQDFSQQLSKIAENAIKEAEVSADELQTVKDTFVERLTLLEQAELETVLRTGKEVRNDLSLTLRNAISTISRLVEEQVAELNPMVADEHEGFFAFTGKETEAVNKLIEDNRASLREKESNFESTISQRVQEFDESAKAALQEDRDQLTEKIKSDTAALEQKIEEVKSRLDELVKREEVELEQALQTNKKQLSTAGTKVSTRLADEVTDWQHSMITMADDFQKVLAADKEAFDQIHRTKIEQQVKEIEEEIKSLASEGQEKISASRKLFEGSLKRLEKKYHDRLEKLLFQFQAAIAQENQLLSIVNLSSLDSRTQAGHELKELLNTRLKARGLEIVKAFKRQVELFDLEYARFSARCSEHIESVSASSKDSLEQHFKAMNNEIERTLRNFRVELSQLNLQLPQIKDAGHAAALAVMAYKRARLSFGGE